MKARAFRGSCLFDSTRTSCSAIAFYSKLRELLYIAPKFNSSSSRLIYPNTIIKRRQDTWNRLQAEMGQKRTDTGDACTRKKKGSAPSEIIVQKLASEPDSKQTYHPVQPREFVDFQYDDLSLNNLKKACAAHFNLPVGTCDILVSNKGPSCSNIAQIPHRKDKVRFR